MLVVFTLNAIYVLYENYSGVDKSTATFHKLLFYVYCYKKFVFFQVMKLHCGRE